MLNYPSILYWSMSVKATRSLFLSRQSVTSSWTILWLLRCYYRSDSKVKFSFFRPFGFGMSSLKLVAMIVTLSRISRVKKHWSPICFGPTLFIFLSGNKEFKRAWREQHMKTGALFQACRLCLNRAVLGSHPHPQAAGSLSSLWHLHWGLMQHKIDQNLLHVEGKRVKIPRSLKAGGERAHLHVLFYTWAFPCSHGPPQLLSGLSYRAELPPFHSSLSLLVHPIWSLKSAETESGKNGVWHRTDPQVTATQFFSKHII